jgi:hypothetical protein
VLLVASILAIVSNSASGVFHIRFMADIDKKRNRDWKTMVLRNVRDAAEEYGRVFSVSYNLAGNALDNTVLDDLKADWIDLIDNEHITSSSSYLHHNGLPVLRIYGIGFKEVRIVDLRCMHCASYLSTNFCCNTFVCYSKLR